MATRTPTTARRASEGFSFDSPARQRPQSRRRAQPQRRPPEVVKQEKRNRFKQIIAPRVTRVIHDIRLLTHGSNRKRYHYTKGDVELMKRTLHEEVDQALAPFVPELEPAKVEFSD